ncbi:hypothetical protein ABZP36_029653 [Zizania latifolia]
MTGPVFYHVDMGRYFSSNRGAPGLLSPTQLLPTLARANSAAAAAASHGDAARPPLSLGVFGLRLARVLTWWECRVVQSGRKKTREPKEENVTLGPTVREGECLHCGIGLPVVYDQSGASALCIASAESILATLCHIKLEAFYILEVNMPI